MMVFKYVFCVSVQKQVSNSRLFFTDHRYIETVQKYLEQTITKSLDMLRIITISQTIIISEEYIPQNLVTLKYIRYELSSDTLVKKFIQNYHFYFDLELTRVQSNSHYTQSIKIKARNSSCKRGVTHSFELSRVQLDIRDEFEIT